MIEVRQLEKTVNYVQAISINLIKAVDPASMAIAEGIADVMKDFTPIDTGYLSRQWEVRRVSKGRVAVVNGSLYAKYIEEGSKLRSHPWPSAGKKTVSSRNRIWSSQAIGGVTRNVTSELINSLAEKHIMSKL